MPIYEYVCKECGHELEALQKISDAPLLACPACEKDALKKKISAPGFRLSGSGWYETDFKSKNQKNLSKGDSADNASADKAGKSDKSDKSDKSGKSDKSDKSDKSAKGATSKKGGKEAVA
jgi:putative FmdB family regulatory protein